MTIPQYSTYNVIVEIKHLNPPPHTHGIVTRHCNYNDLQIVVKTLYLQCHSTVNDITVCDIPTTVS